MNAATMIEWTDANQRVLVAEFAVLQQRLGRQARPGESAGQGPSQAPRQEASVVNASRTAPAGCAAPRDADALADALAGLDAARALLPAPAAIDRLTALFGLSAFERQLLLLLAGVEMDAELARAVPQPTFATALAILPGAHWSALAPDAPLRAWQLLELGAGVSLTQAPLRIDETILHTLAGMSCADLRLAPLLRPLPTPMLLAPEHQEQVEQVMHQLRDLQTQREVWATRTETEKDLRGRAPVVQWTGNDAEGRNAAAASLAQRAGLAAVVLPSDDVPTGALEQERLARLWWREAALRPVLLLIDAGNHNGDELQAVIRFVQRLRTAVMVSAVEPLALPAGPRARIDRPGAGSQLVLWQQALRRTADPGTEAPRSEDPGLRALTAQFHLSAETIQHLASLPTVDSRGVNPARGGQHPLWRACRSAARPGLDDMAQRIEPQAKWGDLVLPESSRGQLKALVEQARHRTTVHDDWGFASMGSRGLGLTALFHGASGVGKTMACEVLAAELDLDLYRIDLAGVVSKYIGETEKNLRRLFDAAAAAGAILLFDEADALFGQRSEVKDHHDRHANREISDLLQRMEVYRGIAVLTTNLRSAIDPAFARRLRFVVHFPFPDQPARAAIWQRVWPSAMPRAALDIDRLARLPLSGGQIRNVALTAAFLAAADNGPVTMAHLAQAARQEAAKGDQAFSEQQLQGWSA